MTDRILDLSEGGARLSARSGLLRIERSEDVPLVTIPLGDLACVVVSNPQVTLTQPALAGLAEAGSAVVVCDQRHLPVAMLLPLQAQHLQAQRFRAQASISLPARKRMWQQLVKAKIRAQGDVLTRLTGGDAGLASLAARVRSGDPDNVEAHAARRY